MKFCVLFIIILLFLSISRVIAQNQRDTPIIELIGSSWGKTTLHALIITNESQAWWKPYFANMTLRAIEQWNQAIDFFSTQYKNYSYLSLLNIDTAVSNHSMPNYDIEILFSDKVLISSIDALGVTSTNTFSNGTIENATITVHSPIGLSSLTGEDYRSVTSHELGHALGLGHSNSSEDLMYPYHDMYSAQYAVSTLDLYALAIINQWIDPSLITMNTSIPKALNLPSQISYRYAPVENPAPTNGLDNPIIKSLIYGIGQPVLFTLFVSILGMLIVLSILILKRRTPKHRIHWHVNFRNTHKY